MRASTTLWIVMIGLSAMLALLLAILWASVRLVDRLPIIPSPVIDTRIRQERLALFLQAVVLNMVGILAGAAAGVGASLFVEDGQLRVSTDIAPLVVIGASLLIFQIAGIVVVPRLTRPAHERISNPEMLAQAAREALRAPGPGTARSLRRSRQYVKRRMFAHRVNGPRHVRHLQPDLVPALAEWSWVESTDSNRRPATHPAGASWGSRDFRRQLYRLATPRVVVRWTLRAPSRLVAAAKVNLLVVVVSVTATALITLRDHRPPAAVSSMARMLDGVCVGAAACRGYLAQCG